MTAMSPVMTTDEGHRHLSDVLAPIEAVLLDRVSDGWQDEFYESVIDPMTPWYPLDDEAGETPVAQFTERVRQRAIRAALEAVVASVSESLLDLPAEIVNGHGYAVEQLRRDLALSRQ